MKRGIDTNVLIYAHLPTFDQHAQARRFLLDQLARPETILVLTPSILHELIHVITDSRRFETPVSIRLRDLPGARSRRSASRLSF